MGAVSAAAPSRYVTFGVMVSLEEITPLTKSRVPAIILPETSAVAVSPPPSSKAPFSTGTLKLDCRLSSLTLTEE